jgi:membrane fusion protein (multidrug efflux system)
MNRSAVRGLLAVAILATLPLMTGCGASAQQSAATAAETAAVEKPEAPATAVEVAVVAQGPVQALYGGTAALEAERAATLVAELPGEVVSVLVEEGDRVVAGQVLARLDGAKARLELARQRSVEERLAHDARRNQELLARSMVSREIADRVRYDHATQSAAVALAALDVDKMEIRAPYAGVITRRHVKEGAWLDVREPAFEIADFDALRARVDVPEHAAAALAAGQSVQFSADAMPGVLHAATVTRVAPVVDAKTGTVAAIIGVDNRAGKLRPGLFVRLSIEQARIADATLLPKAALLDDRNEPQVYVVGADSKAELRSVTLGVEQGQMVQVLTGIEPGTQVITLGQASLKPGDRVEPVNLAAPLAMVGGGG